MDTTLKFTIHELETIVSLTLGQKQKLFSYLIAKMVCWAYAQGYLLTYGEALRTEIQAIANAASGAGISNSLHKIRLAIDFNLFIDNIYRTDSEAYRPLGEFWKSLHPLCRWGGDFKKPDGNHFSLEHEGVR